MRNWFCALLITIAAAFFSATAGHAAEFDLDTSGKIPDVEIFGTLKSGDAARFRKLTANQSKLIVHLNSPGGNLAEALAIGATIHDKGWITNVINGYPCDSACALIWLAGEIRFMSKSARIGFHAAYQLSDTGEPQVSSTANAMVGRYLTLLGLNTKTVLFATEAPPNRLAYVTTANARSLGIDIVELKDAPVATTTSPQTSSKWSETAAVRTGQAKIYGESGIWTVVIDTTLGNGCYLISEFDNGIVFRIGLDRRPDVNNFYFIVGGASWTSLVQGKEYELAFTFDQNTSWNVPMTGVAMGKYVMLRGIFDDATLWEEFAKSRILSISRNGKYVSSINLEGSHAASEKLLACIDQQKKTPATAADPFAE